MKRFSLFLLLACLLIPVSYASDNDRETDRKLLKTMLIDIQHALNTMDMDALMQMVDDDVTISFMTTEIAVGKDQIKAYYNKMFVAEGAPLTSHTTHAKIDAPAVFYGDTATAHGRMDDTFVLKNGETYQFDSRWTVTVVKQTNNWKVASLNFSVNPFHNILLDEIKKQMLMYAALSFLAGMILMMLVGRMRKTDK